MASFLLIHGSAHGAWCWRDTIPALERLGEEARAIDLPSHGADATPPDRVTLELYAEAIAAELRPGDVLVGHSMAGFPITRAAQIASTPIARLVYLCAHVPEPGESIATMRARAPRHLLGPAIQPQPDGITLRIDPALAGDVFYHDCAQSVRDWAVARLCLQAIAPQVETFPEGPIPLDRASYIVCDDDRAIDPDYQRDVARRFDDVHAVATSHSPFLSDPDGLARLLHRIAG